MLKKGEETERRPGMRLTASHPSWIGAAKSSRAATLAKGMKAGGPTLGKGMKVGGMNFGKVKGQPEPE